MCELCTFIYLIWMYIIYNICKLLLNEIYIKMMNTVYAFQDVFKDVQTPSPWFQEFLRRHVSPGFRPPACPQAAPLAPSKKSGRIFYPLQKLYQNCDCHVISI